MEGEINVGTMTVPFQNWQLILAFALPLLIAVITRQTWPRWLKSVTMLVVALIATTVTMYLQGSLNDVSGEQYVGKFLEVVVATIAFYNGVWKPTQIAPAIEAKTAILPA